MGIEAEEEPESGVCVCDQLVSSPYNRRRMLRSSFSPPRLHHLAYTGQNNPDEKNDIDGDEEPASLNNDLYWNKLGSPSAPQTLY